MPSIIDPVYGEISFSLEEEAIIQSPLFQRLRWVSQLSGAQSAFPNATHTRFSHSLGALHVAGQYCQQLTIEDHDRSAVRLAALLHDLAHGAFSHAFDATVYASIYGVPDKGHDIHRHLLIESPLLKPLIEKCGVNVEEIHCIWDPKNVRDPKYRIYAALVQGPLGADRLDFIYRDAFMLKLNFLSRLRLAIDEVISNVVIENGALHYRVESIEAMLYVLERRAEMYRNVYLSPNARRGEILLHEILRSACPCLSLTTRVRDPERFVYLNDHTLIGEIMSSPHCSDTTKELVKRYLRGDLPAVSEGGKQWQTRTVVAIEPERFDNEQIYLISPLCISVKVSDMLQHMRYPLEKGFSFTDMYTIE